MSETGVDHLAHHDHRQVARHPRWSEFAPGAGLRSAPPLVIVDGFEATSSSILEPALVQVYRLRAEEYQQRQRELLATPTPATSADGHRVELLANIDPAPQIPAAKAGGAGESACSGPSSCSCRRAPRCPTR